MEPLVLPGIWAPLGIQAQLDHVEHRDLLEPLVSQVLRGQPVRLVCRELPEHLQILVQLAGLDHVVGQANAV